jgi:hypothetical protein
MGFDSRTGPNWSFLGQDVKKKKSLILSPDAKNDFNHKSKYSKIFLPKGQYSQKYFNPKSKRPSQNMLGLVFKLCGLGSYTGPNLIFNYVFSCLWLRVTSHSAQGHLARGVCKTFVFKVFISQVF